MNKYVKAMVVLSPLLLMSGCFPPGGGKALAADKECTTDTVSEILDKNKDVITTVHVVSGADLEKYLVFVNQERAKRGLWALEADVLIMSELIFGEVGMAMFDKNKCYVPGTFTKDTVAGLRDWFKKAGVEYFMDKLDVEALEKARLAAMPGA